MDWRSLLARAVDPFRLEARTDGPRHRITRQVVCRGLGLVHVIAFLSLWAQVEGLAGAEGIVPAAELGASIEARLGSMKWVVAPSLFWLFPQDTALHLFCAGGVIAGALAMAGLLQGPLLLLCAVLYLSLKSVVQPFLGFQWDTLLIEASVLGGLLGPWALRGWQAPDPMPFAVTLVRWLYFRVMFFAGYVKWNGGDPSWQDFTALKYHYWTQPLPNPVAWVVGRMPGFLHEVSVLGMYACELLLPFLFLLGGRAGVVAFASAALLMGGLQLTGNHGFFQILTVVIAASLVDDEDWRRWRLGWLGGEAGARGRAAEIGGWLRGVLAAALLGLTVLRVWGQVTGWEALPDAPRRVVTRTYAFHVVNSYGLYAVMTKSRPEVEIQGSVDGETWLPYVLPYKPGPVDRAWPVTGPHMPRLDWQMWFLQRFDAHGVWQPSTGCAPWLVRLMERLLEGSAPVEGLFAQKPFDGPPSQVRAVLWEYRPGPPGGDWWTRTGGDPLCPALTR